MRFSFYIYRFFYILFIRGYRGEGVRGFCDVYEYILVCECGNLDVEVSLFWVLVYFFYFV